MMREDIEKGEHSIMPQSNQKMDEKADGSTEPNIDVAESSTKPEINRQVNAEFGGVLAKMISTGAETVKRQREGKVSCCIFRIPQSLKEIHHKGYEPKIVSIGPYHHGKEHLKMMEEHKHRYLKLFLDEAKEGVDINVLGRKLLDSEASIRNSYSDQKLVATQPELLKMVLLDGCFILMLFLFIGLKVDDASNKSPHDPILTTPWILAAIRSDLLLLENQVPFFLLKILLEESKIATNNEMPCNLEELAFKFFKLSMVRRRELPRAQKEEVSVVKTEGPPISEAEHLPCLIRALKCFKLSMFKKEEPSMVSEEGPPNNEAEHLPSLIRALKFFKLSMFKKKEPSLVKEEGPAKSEAKHLLGLIRKNFVDGSSHSPTNTSSSSDEYGLRLILSAKRLRLQGIKFKASHDRSSSKVCYKKIIDYLFNESNVFVPRSKPEKPILDIKLNGNELHIPPIVFDGFISSVLLNCVAFEQLSAECSNFVTSYVAFMGCLMNDEADATYLSEKGIIENYFGSGSDVSQFFKLVCKDLAFDVSNSYLKEVFKGINTYTSSRWNVECARFKHLHFDSPWTLLSSLAVLAAIVLSILQTVFGGLSYRSKAP